MVDPRIRYYETENRGVSSARNFGISLAEGRFIAFLDADDYWYPHFLQEIYTYICRFPEQKVFAAAIELEYKGKVTKAEYSIKKTADYEMVNYFEASCKFTAIFTSSAVFEKDVFEAVGDFDTTVKRGEDTDLWIRIGLSYEILFIWRVGAVYCYDSNSLSRNGKDMRESASFSKYAEFEGGNKALKKFLDLNRFSLAIQSRLRNDKSGFLYFRNSLKVNDLPFRKRLMLVLPSWLLWILVYLKNLWMKVGLGRSVFVP